MKNLKRFTMIAQVIAPDKETLISYIKDGVAMGIFPKPNKNIPALKLNSPCGRTRTYKTYTDIPLTSKRCLCKYHPDHWFIKYSPSSSKAEGGE